MYSVLRITVKALRYVLIVGILSFKWMFCLRWLQRMTFVGMWLIHGAVEFN